MERELWQGTLTAQHCPAWPCPACKKGTAALVPNTLQSEETVDSKREHSNDDWEPEWIAYTFVAWAECTHPSCNQRFALAGIGGVEPVPDDEYGMTLEDYFVPKYCTPMPHLFEIPKKCPNDVRNELLASFDLFFHDSAASANRLRVALELLMRYLGMFTMATGKAAPNLDGAIKNFATNSPELGAQLMALKWLGNTASHDGSASKSDILDAFEILEHVLAEILERRSERVAQLAKELTSRHAVRKTP